MSVTGLQSALNDVRLQRAAAYLRIRGDARPMQVETLRLMQAQTDITYAEGLTQLKAGKLKVTLSEAEGLGNFVDRTVRLKLWDRYSTAGVNAAGAGPVRVNRRENISSGSDLTYRRQMRESAILLTMLR